MESDHDQTYHEDQFLDLAMHTRLFASGQLVKFRAQGRPFA